MAAHAFPHREWKWASVQAFQCPGNPSLHLCTGLPMGMLEQAHATYCLLTLGSLGSAGVRRTKVPAGTVWYRTSLLGKHRLVAIMIILLPLLTLRRLQGDVGMGEPCLQVRYKLALRGQDRGRASECHPTALSKLLQAWWNWVMQNGPTKSLSTYSGKWCWSHGVN